MKRAGCIYKMTVENNTTLYTCVKSDLKLRIYQHKNNLLLNKLQLNINCINLFILKDLYEEVLVW